MDDDRPRSGRLDDGGGAPAKGERFDILADLAGGGPVVVELITSSDAPDTTPYVEDHDEWVVVLEGEAALEVEVTEHRLGPGDWVLLPAGTPHRVLRTAAGTRWLAVHAHAR